jgi:hypothetical protein
MASIRTQLIEQVSDPEAAFDMPAAQLRALQLQAAREVFEQRIEQIPLARNRASPASGNCIRRKPATAASKAGSAFWTCYLMAAGAG